VQILQRIQTTSARRLLRLEAATHHANRIHAFGDLQQAAAEPEGSLRSHRYVDENRLQWRSANTFPILMSGDPLHADIRDVAAYLDKLRTPTVAA
jgi:hypothetical protein